MLCLTLTLFFATLPGETEQACSTRALPDVHGLSKNIRGLFRLVSCTSKIMKSVGSYEVALKALEDILYSLMKYPPAYRYSERLKGALQSVKKEVPFLKSEKEVHVPLPSTVANQCFDKNYDGCRNTKNSTLEDLVCRVTCMVKNLSEFPLINAQPLICEIVKMDPVNLPSRMPEDLGHHIFLLQIELGCLSEHKATNNFMNAQCAY
ncbi:uncharacterized protein LOC144139553 isoform X2 [Haemaphysalis longicornis]